MVWGFSKGTFAARLLDSKFPAPAEMAPADPDGEVLYNKLLRDCVTFRSPTDAVEEVIRPYPQAPLGGPTENPCKIKPF